MPVLSNQLSLQGEVLKISEGFKYLGISFNKKGIDTNACVSRLGESMSKAARALLVMGLVPRNYPLHIIANHFRVYARSCGEYALAILPLSNSQMMELEGCQYRGIKFLLKSDARVSRMGLLACLALATVRLRFNLLSAKWFDNVINHKGTDFLVKQAWIDFSRQPPTQSHSSSFHLPSGKNPITS